MKKTEFSNIVIVYDFKWSYFKKYLTFRLLFVVTFFITHFMFHPSPIDLTSYESKVYYAKVKKNFKWINKDLFFYILKQSERTGLEVNLICALIQTESGGKNIISRKNKNGSRDFGYCQVNDCHVSDTRILLDPVINLTIGCNYLKKCFKKSKGEFLPAIRMYNQGAAGKSHRYKNWKYTSKILNKYIMASL